MDYKDIVNQINKYHYLFVTKKKIILFTFNYNLTEAKEKNLNKLINYFSELSKKNGLRIIFPIHPRTQQKILLFKIRNLNKLQIINPCGYFDFLALQKYAKVIFTDSGGIQEEACILKTPCLTIRKNTERPETVKIKSNILTGYSLSKIDYSLNKIVNSKIKWKNPYGINVSDKILKILIKKYKNVY